MKMTLTGSKYTGYHMKKVILISGSCEDTLEAVTFRYQLKLGHRIYRFNQDVIDGKPGWITVEDERGERSIRGLSHSLPVMQGFINEVCAGNYERVNHVYRFEGNYDWS